jgi:hypothetical protein
MDNRSQGVLQALARVLEDALYGFADSVARHVARDREPDAGIDRLASPAAWPVLERVPPAAKARSA